MISRRAFLAALACLPVVGKFVPKAEPQRFRTEAFALTTLRPVFDLAPPHEHEYGEWSPWQQNHDPWQQNHDGSSGRWRQCRHCRTVMVGHAGPRFGLSVS